jgi:hypothetical protein
VLTGGPRSRCVWEAANGKLVAEAQGPFFSFSPGGRYVLAGGINQPEEPVPGCQVCDMVTGKKLGKPLPLPERDFRKGKVPRSFLSPGGKYFVTCGRICTSSISKAYR